MRRVLKWTSLAVAALATPVALWIASVSLFAFDPPEFPDTAPSVAEMEAVLEEQTDANVPPGLSVVVLKDGRTVYKNSFGLADGRTGRKVTNDSNFGWWSVTKIPTAIAAMQLIERGEMSLDDPVAAHLPFFKVTYPSPEQGPVRIRHLLNHSSGIQEPLAVLFWMHPEGEGPYRLTDFVAEKLPKYAKLDFAPGTQVKYTNLGYMVLGAVIEAVSGMSYEDFVRSNILAPLDMRSTDFSLREDMLQDVAVGSHPLFDFTTTMMPFGWSYMIGDTHWGRGLIWLNRFYAHANPPSGLFGPADEAAQILRAMMNGGEVDGRRLLQPETVDLMLSAETPADAGAGERRVLGWLKQEGPRDRVYFSHSGGGVAYYTQIRFYPAERLGIVVFTNNTKGHAEAIADMLAGMDWPSGPDARGAKDAG